MDGLRIQALTERADVGTGSFYNHFSSKEELVETVVSESLSRLAAATTPAEWREEDPADVAAGAFVRFIRLAYDDRPFASLVVNLSNSEALFCSAVQPYARETPERGVLLGRFTLARMDVALSASVGGAYALHALLSYGIGYEEAVRVVRATAARITSRRPDPVT